MKYEHEGHRQRMWEKLKREEELPDHEILEVLLFGAMPRRNTNDLAHRLLAKFGSLLGVYSAPIEELKTVQGVGDAVARNIYFTGVVYRRYFIKRHRQFSDKYNTQGFLAYVKQTYEHERCEVVDLYLLDEEGIVKGVKRFTSNDVHSVRLEMTEVSRFLMENLPAGIVVVHNHPQGRAVASLPDDEMTKCCQILCNMYSVLLCDHIIYSPEGIYSYYMDGKMGEISKNFTLNRLAKGEGGQNF